MFDWLTSNIDKVLIAAGAVVVLFWPKVKELITAGKAATQVVPADGQCPLCFPVSSNPTDKDRPEWVVVTMEIEQFCASQRLTKAVRLCHELCNELVAGEAERPTAATVAKSAAKRTRK